MRRLEVDTRSRLIHRQLSYQVMNAVFEVHNVLGPGFAENVYEEALELRARSIPFHRQKQVLVKYNERVVGSHRLDILVDDKIVLELKAESAPTDVFRRQVLPQVDWATFGHSRQLRKHAGRIHADSQLT